MKSKQNKGFTLVELIVVLVILAILAMLLIPALTGYIDKSRKSQVIAETRMLHSAIQTELSDFYGSNGWGPFVKESGTASTDTTRFFIADQSSSGEKKDRYDQILKLAEVPSLSGNSPAGSFGAYFTEDGKVALIIYDNGKGEVGIYFNDTGETLAYDKSDFSSFLSYYSVIKGKLYYTKKEWYPGTMNPLISKEYVLSSYGLGYKTSTT